MVLLVGKRSERTRKRRPVKIVSFDTDGTGSNSSPASSAVSPTTLIPPVCNVAVSGKTQTSSCELDDRAVDIVKALSDDAVLSCRSEAEDTGSLPGSVACAADKTESAIIDNSLSDALTLPKHRVGIVESEFTRHRTSSLPEMGNQFNTELYNQCSDDIADNSSQDINILTYSSSSTVKPDDFEGPQDLPSCNAWFDDFRDRVSNAKSADAESIGSNASSASSSSVNNQSRFVFLFCVC